MTDVKIRDSYCLDCMDMVKEKTFYWMTRLTWNIDDSALLSRTLKRDYGLISSYFSYLQYSRANMLLV